MPLSHFQRRLLPLSCLLVSILLLPTGSPAQPATLVADLAIGRVDRGSFPSGFTYFAGKVYFTASLAEVGRELWRTDGTAAGTERVADLCPGPCSAFAAVVAVTEDFLFLRAQDAVLGEELWSLNTEGVLEPLGDLCPGPCSSYGFEAGVLDNQLFFSATDEVSGMELWVSDGTRAGTRSVRDICPGACAGAPTGFTPYQGRMYFAADDGETGRELWRSDGTEAGTERVMDLCADCDGDPKALAVVRGFLHFGADDGVGGRELWRTDGTAARTELLADLIPGPVGSDPQRIFTALNRIYVQGECTQGRIVCVWRSNGLGWVPADELLPRSGRGRPYETVEVDGELYFSSGGRGGGASEVWATRGSSGGTRQVLDALTDVTGLTALPGGLLFGATVLRDDTFLRTLWFSDGTPEGTVPFQEAGIDIEVFSPRQPVATPLGVFFRAQREFSNAEPWITDGTPAGTRQVLDLRFGPASADPSSGIELGGRLVFKSEESRRGVWATDGTEAGTELLAEPADAFVPVGEEVFFLDSIGASLNTTDGTPDGTRQLVAFSSRERTRSLAPLDGDGESPRLLFGDFTLGQRIWSFDPREEHLELAADINPLGWSNEPCVFSPCPTAGFFPNFFTAAQRGTFFLGSEEDTPIQLWMAEIGSAGGEVEVRRLHTFDTGVILRRLFPEVPTEAFAPRDFVPFDGGVLFAAFETDTGFEPWVSDGTVEGTRPIGDLIPGAAGSNPYGFTVVSEEVEEGRILFAYFFTRGPEGGALWRTDGTAVGTRRITALRHDDEPAFAADAAGRNVVWDGTFYFAAATVSTGEELWVSDGTVDGTRLLTDIRPGPRGAGIRDLTVVAARGRSALLFAADDGVHGHELWTVQGGQPRLVQDIEAGPGSSSPSDFVVAGTRVYFAAWDHEHGRELWSLPFAHLIRPPGSDPGSDPEGILPVRRPR